MSRASNLLNRIQSWTEEDWLLLRHHYPKDVARFAALLRDGPPRESERPEDPAPPAEGPAPLSELRQDSAPVLQLRRDVRWLEDRGVGGSHNVSSFTVADLVGLDLDDFNRLSLRARQKFENRAYTALRVLNGGGR